MNKDIIQKYVNDFRRKLTPFLKSNIGIEVGIYNCGNEGAILILHFKVGGKSIDQDLLPYNKISEALANLDQNFFTGNIEGINFKGTNMMMEHNRIIIIKDSNDTEWSEQKLKEDIEKIIQPPSTTN